MHEGTALLSLCIHLSEQGRVSKYTKDLPLMPTTTGTVESPDHEDLFQAHDVQQPDSELPTTQSCPPDFHSQAASVLSPIECARPGHVHNHCCTPQQTTTAVPLNSQTITAVPFSRTTTTRNYSTTPTAPVTFAPSYAPRAASRYVHTSTQTTQYILSTGCASARLSTSVVALLSRRARHGSSNRSPPLKPDSSATACHSLIDQGYHTGPAALHQDSQSAVALSPYDS
jgi:hypothetical protein